MNANLIVLALIVVLLSAGCAHDGTAQRGQDDDWAYEDQELDEEERLEAKIKRMKAKLKRMQPRIVKKLCILRKQGRVVRAEALSRRYLHLFFYANANYGFEDSDKPILPPVKSEAWRIRLELEECELKNCDC